RRPRADGDADRVEFDGGAMLRRGRAPGQEPERDEGGNGPDLSTHHDPAPTRTPATIVRPRAGKCTISSYFRSNRFSTRSSAATSGRRESPLTSASSAPTSATVDRKSTRLNSSHVKISYAVFCLKKKTYS